MVELLKYLDSPWTNAFFFVGSVGRVTRSRLGVRIISVSTSTSSVRHQVKLLSDSQKEKVLLSLLRTEHILTDHFL